MNKIKLQNWLQEAIPLLLWLGFVLLPFLMRSASMPAYVRTHFLENIFLTNLLLLAVFYLHAYGIYPLRKRKNGIWLYVLALAACMAAFMFVSQRISPGPQPAVLAERARALPYPGSFQHRDSFPGPEHFPRPGGEPPMKVRLLFPGFRITPFFFVILCSYCYCILRDTTKRERALKEHENENLKTELTFLRSQISPHFMFNVLNSMVSLARKQSPLLEASLINMSNLMRYMLYESNGKLVSLNTELEYLRNYIDLQLLRYGDSVRLNLYINGQAEHYHIEPMLLIPFVENAFKHGISMIKDPLIDISVSVNNETGELLFNVVNNISPQENKDEGEIGIGLANVKRRLALLYPEKHHLKIERARNLFNVELQIKLT
ncbi:sensor histidine kinase [Arcticibacter tournemirensis]